MTRDKFQELIDAVRAGNKKDETSPVVIALAVIAGIAAIALIAFAVYRFLTPDYFDDYDDDDDFEDDFEDEEAKAAPAEACSEDLKSTDLKYPEKRIENDQRQFGVSPNCLLYETADRRTESAGGE